MASEQVVNMGNKIAGRMNIYFFPKPIQSCCFSQVKYWSLGLSYIYVSLIHNLMDIILATPRDI